MEAIILNSSARKNGNTALMLERYKRALEAGGAKVEQIDLASLRIGMCKGCRLCFDKGEDACPHKDDVLELYGKLLACELVIVGGPIYVEDVNGILKNWIDRMAFNCHRPSLYAQKAFIALDSGSGASRHALKTAERALQTWGMRLVGERKLVLGAKIGEDEFAARFGALVERDAAKLLRELGRKRAPSFLQVMTYRIQKWFYANMADKASYDYAYWNERGWLEVGRRYYSGEEVGVIKAAGASILGALVIKLVLK